MKNRHIAVCLSRYELENTFLIYLQMAGHCRLQA